MKISSLLSLIILLGSLSAQNFVINTPDTVKIFAVMVEFQEDKDNATEGNGKFGTIYGKDYGSGILDPLPHDLSYFNNHLEFAKNYFNKVSKGKFTVDYTVLQNVITVSQTMRNYTSLNRNETVNKLSDFTKEVWETADQFLQNVDLDGYDLFAIFHAGVGGDLITPGAIISTRDMPSLYLSQKSLQSIYGNDFQGFPVSNNSKLITNSMIIPETESREVSGLTGSVLLELSINGLIVSSVASHLGLPDLFDTETGKSSIGRFGLMDGQSIFGYAGTFLPEPSAWEKIALGWETPVEISPADQSVTLTSPAIAGALDTTIVKIPINSTEYFLVERRSRDANDDGCIVTMKDGNQTFTRTFRKDTSGFYYYEADSLRGVIVDVDEPDWALPGLEEDYDPETDNFSDAGLIIWHIDESIIADNLESNSVNLIDNRGVKIVEADGIEDIGEEFTTIFGDKVIVEGSKYDTWYSGNSSELYENKLAADTRPNTNSNDGTSSLITMSNFSSIAPKMSFDVSFGNENFDLVLRQDLSLANTQYVFTSFRNPEETYLISQGNLLRKTKNNSLQIVLENFSDFKPLSVIKWVNNEKEQFLVGTYSNELTVVYLADSSEKVFKLETSDKITTCPVIISEGKGIETQIAVGLESGSIQLFNIYFEDAHLTIENIIYSDRIIIGSNNSKVQYIASLSEIIFWGNSDGFTSSSSTYQNVDIGFSKIIVTEIENDIIVFGTDGTNIYKIYANSTPVQIPLPNGLKVNDFIIAYLKNDNEPYVIFSSGTEVYVINTEGIIADNFPVKNKTNIDFTNELFSINIPNTSRYNIVAFTKDGNIITISGDGGKIIDEMSISLGDKPKIYPSIEESNGDFYLNALSVQNELVRWKLLYDISEGCWLSQYGNSTNSSSVADIILVVSNSEYFRKNSAYNWPNPVYEGSTNIRYYVSENSKVNIKIFDVSGDLVDELDDNAVGGIDNETVWNVQDVQSGVYFARIKVDSQSSGKSDEKIIKIAIVK